MASFHCLDLLPPSTPHGLGGVKPARQPIRLWYFGGEIVILPNDYIHSHHDFPPGTSLSLGHFHGPTPAPIITPVDNDYAANTTPTPVITPIDNDSPSLEHTVPARQFGGIKAIEFTDDKQCIVPGQPEADPHNKEESTLSTGKHTSQVICCGNASNSQELNTGHHVYTNIDGSDPDVETVNEAIFLENKAIPKLVPNVSIPAHLHAISLLIPCHQNEASGLSHPLHNEKSQHKNQSSQYLPIRSIFTDKALHVLYGFLIPLLYMPLPSLLIMNLISDMVMGLWLAIVTQINHVNTKVNWPSPPDQSKNNQPYDRN